MMTKEQVVKRLNEIKAEKKTLEKILKAYEVIEGGPKDNDG